MYLIKDASGEDLFKVKMKGKSFSLDLMEEKQVIQSKTKQPEDTLVVIEKETKSLQDKLETVTQNREKAYESIQQLRKQCDEGNTHFYQSRTILNKTRELVAKKNTNAIEELSQSKIDKFVSLWSSDKAFRNDYEKIILQSLDIRQLSRDARMRNPDEKPLLEAPKPSKTDTLVEPNVKLPKEESKSPPQETLPPQKVQKEVKNKGKDLESNVENRELAETDDLEYEKPQKVNADKELEVDLAKLKEMKREEEIAKTKRALEMKNLQEKIATKVAVRAQKEVEKKLNECGKKAKKKVEASAPVVDIEEAAAALVEATEKEKFDDNVEVQKEGEVSLQYYKIEDQLVDIFMKAQRHSLREGSRT